MGKISSKDKQVVDAKKFIEDNIETFEYIVKYKSVIDALIKSVSRNEIKAFNEQFPCKCRAECDEPFKCQCIIATNGESIKTTKQCKECQVRGKL